MLTLCVLFKQIPVVTGPESYDKTSRTTRGVCFNIVAGKTIANPKNCLVHPKDILKIPFTGIIIDLQS